MNIPRLYKENTSDFTDVSCSLGPLPDGISCKVTEALNGGFELVLEYPVTGGNFDNLKDNRIILAPPNPYDNWQPFRIYKITRLTDSTIKVNAEHKYYELSGYPVKTMLSYKDVPVPAVAFTGWLSSECARNAMQLSATAYTITTDMPTSSEYRHTWEIAAPTDIKSVMSGLVQVFGGDWKIDGTTLTFMSERGEDRNVKVMYGSNLVDLQQEETDSTYTHVMPFWAKGVEEVYLDPPYISFSDVSNTALPRVLILDLTGEFDDAPTASELQTAAEEYMDSHEQKGTEYSQTVRFVPRGQTVEYASLGDIDHVELGDTVGIEAAPLGISTTLRCISLTYDVYRGVYESCVLGKHKPSLSTPTAKTVMQSRSPIVWSAVAEPTKNIMSGDYWIKINNLSDMHVQQLSRLDGKEWKVLCDLPSEEEMGTTVTVGSDQPHTAKHHDLWLVTEGGYIKEVKQYGIGTQTWFRVGWFGGIGETLDSGNERVGDYSSSTGNEIAYQFTHSFAEGTDNEIIYREMPEEYTLQANHIGGCGNTLYGGEAMLVLGNRNNVRIRDMPSGSSVKDYNRASIVSGFFNVVRSGITDSLLIGSNNEFGLNVNVNRRGTIYRSIIAGWSNKAYENVYDCIICGEQNTSINYDMACSIVCGKNNYSYSSSQYFAFTNAIVGGEGNHAHRNGLTIGTYCEDIASSNSDSYLVVGIGSDGNNRRTGLRFNSSGDLFIAGQLHQGGADYAVCLEWLDGNPNGEDRRGRLVALEGEKITFANGKDIYGVISGDSTVVENAAPNEWHGRYLRDI